MVFVILCADTGHAENFVHGRIPPQITDLGVLYQKRLCLGAGCNGIKILRDTLAKQVTINIPLGRFHAEFEVPHLYSHMDILGRWITMCRDLNVDGMLQPSHLLSLRLELALDLGKMEWNYKLRGE